MTNILFNEKLSSSDAETFEAARRYYALQLGLLLEQLTVQEIELLFQRLKEGLTYREALASMDIDMTSLVNSAYQNAAQEAAWRAAYEGYKSTIRDLNAQERREYDRERSRSVPWKPVPPKKIAELLDKDRFERTSLVENLLLSKQHYSGNFYSIYFKGLNDNEIFQDIIVYSFQNGVSWEETSRSVLKHYDDNNVIRSFTKEQLDNVIRTESQSAVQQGKTAAGLLSENVKYFQYKAVLDYRTYATCRQCNGRIFEKTNTKLLLEIQPPRHYSCRCTLLALSDRSLRLRGISKEKVASDMKVLSSVKPFQWHKPEEG